jgi:hypothetical protein
MPTPLYAFNTPENFDTAWIYVRPNSALDGESNPKVPRSLSSIQSTKGTWALVVDGQVKIQNASFESSNNKPTFGIAGGGHYSAGDLKIAPPAYNDRQDTSTTENQVLPGEFLAGPAGNGFTEASPNETAWYVFEASGTSPWTLIVWDGEIIFFGPYTQHNLVDNPGDTLFGNTTYDQGNTSHPDYGDGNIGDGVDVGAWVEGDDVYTRGQKVSVKSTSSSGAFQNTFADQIYINEGAPSGDVSVHKVAKKIQDTTQQVLVPSSIDQNTYYEFYEVLWTTPAEVDNFSTSAVLVIPNHILQRSLARRSSAMKINGLNLGESFLRVAADMATGLTEVKDLSDNYGIEAQAIPIVLNIGGNAVSIGINQIADIAINNNQQNHILRYDSATEKWQNVLSADIAYSGSYSDLINTPPDPSITSLIDTDITNDDTSANTLADGHILRWDDSLSVWVNDPETAEVNDLSSAVTWAEIPDLYITESSVTQHQGALSITQSQITDLPSFTDADVDTHLNQNLATTGQALSWNGSDYSWVDIFDGTYASLTGTPTTLAGYGITDAAAAADLTALAARVTDLETFQSTHAPNDETHP